MTSYLCYKMLNLVSLLPTRVSFPRPLLFSVQRVALVGVIGDPYQGPRGPSFVYIWRLVPPLLAPPSVAAFVLLPNRRATIHAH